MKRFYLLGFVFLGAVFSLSFFFQQDDFYTFFPIFAILFGSFILLIFNRSKIGLTQLLVLGVLARILLVPLFPNLSDDIFRFFWDGNLWDLGIHPFDFTPSELFEQGVLNPSMIEHFTALNSKDYYTIYPPVMQLVFYLSVALKGDIYTVSILLKSIYLLADLLTCLGLIRLLSHFRLDKKLAMIYFLNPLMIVELVGNIHGEVMMVAFLVWMFVFLVESKSALAGLMYGLSIATKILPFIVGPILLFFLWKKKKWLPFFGAATLVVVTSFFFLLKGSNIEHLLTSINLYFQSFEFNASFYYLSRQLGFHFTGYNQIAIIGPLLAKVSLVTILLVSYRATSLKDVNYQIILPTTSLIFIIFLLLSTTVHPWYLAPALAFSIFDRRLTLFTLIWSFLIILSYAAYSYIPVTEQTSFLFIEYGVLFLLFISYLFTFRYKTQPSI